MWASGSTSWECRLRDTLDPGREGRSRVTSSSVVETTGPGTGAGRHPGGRPRRRAAHLRRRGRPPGDLRRGHRGPGPGPVDHLAPARGPGEQPAARALRARGVRRRPAVRALRRPPRPQRPAGPAGPADARADRRARPARTCTSRSPTAAAIAHIAQVDSTYLLGARDWTDIEIPPHSSALGKVLLAWDAMPRPGGRLETPTGHTLRTRGDLDVDLAQVRTRGFAVTRDELEVGLAGVAAPVFGPDKDVVAAVGVSGPTARLEGRLERARSAADGPHGAAVRAAPPRHAHGTASRGPERDTA